MTTRVSSDKYMIGRYIQDIKNKHIPADDGNTLMLGIFGYLNEIHSNIIQDNIELSSQWSNEIFPIRAQLEKNLITHAMMAGITDLNAIPSTMDMLIGIKERDLIRHMVNDILILNTDIPIFIEDFEFHLENDIRILRQKGSDGKNIYLAQYDFDPNNKLTSITNPYLLPPVQTRIGNDLFVLIRARIRQISISSFNKKIISTNRIENKTFEFTYTDQLADFRVYVKKSNGEIVEFEPIYDNAPILDKEKMYVRYIYANSHTIRVSFINSVYIPDINDEIEVKILTTTGSRGNFSYKKQIIITPESDRINYEDLLILGIPATPAEFGINKKSIDDLKTMIPRELLSRGSITCNQDLENFFNVINDKYSRLRFLKKVDNQFERTYSSFMLLKDSDDNIIPSNTVDVHLKESDFDVVEDRLILKPGTPLEYNKTTDKCTKIPKGILSTNIIEKKESEGFLYGSPFTIVVNKSPLSVSHYLTIFDRRYILAFKQISDIPLLQFISTSVSWNRGLVVDEDYYKMDIRLDQNIDEEFNLITIDEDTGLIDECNVRVIGVFYNEKDEPIRYIDAIPINYNPDSKSYNFRFNLKTNNNITRDSRIEILNTKEIGTTNSATVLFPAVNCKMEIYVLAKGISNLENRDKLDSMVPGLDKYTLCNVYEVDSGVDFYINFSHVVSSVVRPVYDKGSNKGYLIDEIPVVKYSHLLSTSQTRYLVNYIMDKKVFIDRAIELLENNFEIDFKFFNTYGPSKIYKVGNTDISLDRVNLKITLRIKFATATNTESFIKLIKQEIKTYVENLDKIGNFHVSDITTILKNKFEFISYIEFAKINEYDTDHQSLLIDNTMRELHVPEFINIGSKSIEYVPDIDIIVL